MTDTITQDDLLATVRDQQREINRLTRQMNALQKDSDRSWRELNEYMNGLEKRLQIDFDHQPAIDRHFAVIYTHLGIDVSDATEDSPLLSKETARRLAALRKPWHARIIDRMVGRRAASSAMRS